MADADFTYPKDTVFRTELKQRYVGIGLGEQGRIETYRKKKEPLHFEEGVNCFVLNSPAPFFMKVSGGQRLRFRGLYLQERFFAENHIPLSDSFWRDAKNTIHGANLHAPELAAVCRRVEQCSLTGAAFDTWLRGVGLEAAGYLISLIEQLSRQTPIFLEPGELDAVNLAKAMISNHLKNPPAIPALCKLAGINKNKLQEGFRLTEGKTVAEYTRTLRMERALSLLEDQALSIPEIAEAVGYRGISNFYAAFQKTFGQTPASFQKMLRASCHSPL